MKYILSFCLFIAVSCFASTTVMAQTAATSTTSSIQSLTVKVTGVSCNTDVKTIGAAVEKLDGVSSCSAAKRGAVTRFVVQYDPQVVCEDDIFLAVENTPGCKNPNDRPYRVKL